jgi:membrane protease YdiL (CAAX protease family)
MSRHRALKFCLLVFALSWPVQIGVVLAYRNPESVKALPWGICAMFTPALVTIGFAICSHESRNLIRWRPTWAALPLAFAGVLVPTLIAFATIAAVQLGGWGKSGWFVFSSGGVAISGGPWILGRGVQHWSLFIINVLATGAYFAVLNTIAAAGEELGWRGFLQPLLVAELGTIRGIALVGLIWSFWHLPVLLAGYNFPQHPLLGAFVLFPAELVAASFFLGWLTVRSGSFWPAAVAHGAVNSIESGVTHNIIMAAPHIYEDLTQLLLTIATGLLFWWLLYPARRIRAAGNLASS